MARLKLGVSMYRDADLSVKVSVIITCLTGNPHFPSPIPLLTPLQTAADAFNTALSNTGASKEATILKNQARTTLEGVFVNMGLYLQLQSNGDEAILSTTGYDLVSKSVPFGVLPKPENFTAKPGDARGSIKLSVKTVDGAKSYLFEYTEFPATGNSVWKNDQTTKSNTVIEDLNSGQQYAFRAVAIGSDPTRVYSDEISSFVL